MSSFVGGGGEELGEKKVRVYFFFTVSPTRAKMRFRISIRAISVKIANFFSTESMQSGS